MIPKTDVQRRVAELRRRIYNIDESIDSFINEIDTADVERRRQIQHAIRGLSAIRNDYADDIAHIEREEVGK